MPSASSTLRSVFARKPGGEQVLETLKVDTQSSKVPVVVISVEDDTGLSRRLGADDHFTKPVNHVRLQAWLQQLLARGTADEALAR